MKKALAMVNPASGSSRFLAFCCAILFMVLLPGLLLAGTGIIKGKVTDRDTKQGLPSANIIIKGTRIGTTADLDGNFTIPNAPTGQQTITVSYIGYATVNIPVTVKEDGVVRHDFALRAEALKGKEYVITAQAQGQVQAINQQLAESRISSVVSEAKIQELPDFNAAAAISRLPGVSTLESSGEANKSSFAVWPRSSIRSHWRGSSWPPPVVHRWASAPSATPPGAWSTTAASISPWFPPT